MQGKGSPRCPQTLKALSPAMLLRGSESESKNPRFASLVKNPQRTAITTKVK
jgi:hypothetical protein